MEKLTQQIFLGEVKHLVNTGQVNNQGLLVSATHSILNCLDEWLEEELNHSMLAALDKGVYRSENRSQVEKQVKLARIYLFWLTCLGATTELKICKLFHCWTVLFKTIVEQVN